LAVAGKYGYKIYDALVVASALEAKCTTLYSEDMQHGQLIEKQLTIRNPFH
jgi:predicted nucleic acid-binding protein